MPTLCPGWNLVPRWRTKILPASTYSPPNFFTPSRWPALSRPLRDEPPAFLWAMLAYSFFFAGRFAGAFFVFSAPAADFAFAGALAEALFGLDFAGWSDAAAESSWAGALRAAALRAAVSAVAVSGSAEGWRPSVRIS